jgi:hypothetical protein
MQPVVVDVNRQLRAVSWPAFSQGFNLEKLTGWKPGSVGVRAETIEVEDGHGEYDLPVFRGRRTIELSGYVVAESDRQLNRFGDQLASVLADGGRGPVVVTEQGEQRWARARLHGTPKFETTFRNRADFELELRCPDPRIFGHKESIAGYAVEIVNWGTFPSSPTIQVSGSGSNDYAVYGPEGRKWLVSRDLVAGHPHTLDIESGDLIIDGQLILDGLVEAEPFACPPGQGTSISFDPNGNDAMMTVTNYSAYI